VAPVEAAPGEAPVEAYKRVAPVEAAPVAADKRVAPVESAPVESRVVATGTHGRYLLRRPAGEAERIVVGFHGYRENAARHLAELERIPWSERWALVAVDALHAFYAGSTGEVIRGWMTRELREESIADNVAYVGRVLTEVRAELGWGLPIAFVGFSQGASMAWRAALLAGHGAGTVVAFAGDIPPELAALDAPFPSSVLLVHGDGDDWYVGKRPGDEQLLRDHAVVPEVATFAGGHEWTDAARAAIGRFLSGV
jgi:predicted esterase